MAAATVFTMLYVGAVEGSGRLLAPKQVYRMTRQQAARTRDVDRSKYAEASLRAGFAPVGQRWYADNTREPIRDETLRDGLVGVGAVVVRPDVPTTSGRPRYALKASFAALFDPHLTGTALEEALKRWRTTHLSPSAPGRALRASTRHVYAGSEAVGMPATR